MRVLVGYLFLQLTIIFLKLFQKKKLVLSRKQSPFFYIRRLGKKDLTLIISLSVPFLMNIQNHCWRLRSKTNTVKDINFLMHVCALSCFSCVPLWNPIDCSLPGSLSMWFPRQEYWSGLPCSPLRNLPDPGIKPTSPGFPALQVDSSPPAIKETLIWFLGQEDLLKKG